MGTRFTSTGLEAVVADMGGMRPSPADAADGAHTIVSLVADTDGEGRIVLAIALDAIRADDRVVERKPLASYQIDRHADALHDAVVLAALWRLPLRGATADDGWVAVDADWHPLE